MLGRLVHDGQNRGVRATRHRLVPRGPEQPPEQHALRARLLIARLPTRSLERLAADAGMPDWLSDPFAVHVVARRGAAHFLRAARSHRSERQLWKRIAALRILCAAGHPEAGRLLRTALLSGEPDLAGAAVALLVRQPNREAAKLLVHALRANLHPRSRVAARLDRFPLDVPDLILSLARDTDTQARYWGATLLARYGAAPETAEALEALTADADPSVRKAAIESLGVVGGPRAAAVAVRLLGDNVFFVRAHAARALGDLERVDLAHHVLPLLADPEWWVRTAAKDALQAMGPAVAPVVAGCLDHEDRFARNGAAEVLQNLGVVDTIADRARRGDATETDRLLVEKAVAEGGITPIRGRVRRLLPAAADRMRLLLTMNREGRFR